MDIKLYLIIFTIFKYCLFFSSICVFLNVQTIYSVFGLILAFISGACLSILVGATFIGFISIVVYVGAVLVFFLFVTMMLNLRSESKSSGIEVFYIFFILLSTFLWLDIYHIWASEISEELNFAYLLNYQSNIVVIGYLLYTLYCIPLLICGQILFIAMLGAIVLLLYYPTNLNKRSSIMARTQDISLQTEYQDFEAIVLDKFKIYYY